MSSANPNSATKSPKIAFARNELRSEPVSGLQVPWRRIGIYVVLAAGFFLLGAVPMWMRARDSAAKSDLARKELALSQMENRLSEAVIDARRGDYEPARQTASDFFSALRNRIDQEPEQAATTARRAYLSSLLSQRDDIITLLARSDPASADRLSNLYVAYRKATGEVQPQRGRP